MVTRCRQLWPQGKRRPGVIAVLLGVVAASTEAAEEIADVEETVVVAVSAVAEAVEEIEVAAVEAAA
jgi:hypothetical protein